MKRMLAVFMILAFLLPIGAFAEAFTAGTYEATVPGHNGDLTVAVTFDAESIIDVRVTSNVETEEVAGLALKQIPRAILDKQSLDVDAVSGATVTSNAILSAVEDCIRAAGADPALFRTEDEAEPGAETPATANLKKDDMMIFSPYTVKGVTFKNRIVMPPVTVFELSSENGTMGDALSAYYMDRTDKEIGLLIIQALFVMPSFTDLPWAVTEENMMPLRQIAEAAHANGTKVFAQLVMNGAEFEYYGGVNGLSTEDMAYIRDCFIRAAKLCKEAGLDGIELHGAHELFMNQVSSGLTNQRTDRYGGDLSGRLTFAREIIEGIQEFAGEDFIVSYRMGATFNLEEDIQTAQLLEEAGLDMIHVSYGISDVQYASVPESFGAYNLVVYTGSEVKRHVNIPAIVVNSIMTLQRGNVLLERGDAQFVAYGRPLYYDASFVLKEMEQFE